MICPKCGSNNSDGTAFCASCGAPLSNEAPTPNGAVPNNNVPPQTPPPVFNGNPYGGPIEQRNIALCIIFVDRDMRHLHVVLDLQADRRCQQTDR